MRPSARPGDRPTRGPRHVRALERKSQGHLDRRGASGEPANVVPAVIQQTSSCRLSPLVGQGVIHSVHDPSQGPELGRDQHRTVH